MDDITVLEPVTAVAQQREQREQQEQDISAESRPGPTEQLQVLADEPETQPQRSSLRLYTILAALCVCLFPFSFPQTSFKLQSSLGASQLTHLSSSSSSSAPSIKPSPPLRRQPSQQTLRMQSATPGLAAPTCSPTQLQAPSGFAAAISGAVNPPS